MGDKLYKRIQKGAAELDRRIGDWPYRIDLRTLNLGDCKLCMLGQLFDNYVRGREMLGFDVMQSEAHGFTNTKPSTPPNPSDRYNYGPLTKAWGRLILRRLGERFRNL